MRAIFVVGTGRSGTHFTIRLLNGFEHAVHPLEGRENPAILKDIARAALHHRLPSAATGRYYREMFGQAGGILLDQHHPNLFFLQHWSRIFDGIVFLYPMRPTYQVVASMLRHEGVLRWYDYARTWKQRTIHRIPYPNRFLGLSRFSQIDSLPPHLLCAHRVIAHRKAFEDQVGPMNGALRSVSYEALVTDPFAEFSRVFSADEMSRLGRFSLVEKPNAASLSKFRDVLSDEQVSEIIELERQVFP